MLRLTILITRGDMMTKDDVIRRHEVMNSVLGILVIDEHLRRQFKETLSTLSSLKEEAQDREKLETLKECLENVELEPIEDEPTYVFLNCQSSADYDSLLEVRDHIESLRNINGVSPTASIYPDYVSSISEETIAVDLNKAKTALEFRRLLWGLN